MALGAAFERRGRERGRRRPTSAFAGAGRFALDGRFQHPQRSDGRARELALLERAAQGSEHGAGRGDEQLVIALAGAAIHAPLANSEASAPAFTADGLRLETRFEHRQDGTPLAIDASMRLFMSGAVRSTSRIGDNFHHFGGIVNE
jgi:hypothetical protein